MFLPFAKGDQEGFSSSSSSQFPSFKGEIVDEYFLAISLSESNVNAAAGCYSAAFLLSKIHLDFYFTFINKQEK